MENKLEFTRQEVQTIYDTYKGIIDDWDGLHKDEEDVFAKVVSFLGKSN